MTFSEPSGVTALQSPALKASLILDPHTPGSAAVENSVRVKVKVPHALLLFFPSFSALLFPLLLRPSHAPPEQLISSPSVNGDDTPRSWTTSHSLDPTLWVPFSASCWASPYSSTITCIHLAVQRPQRPFVITMLSEMKPRGDVACVSWGSRNVDKRGKITSHTAQQWSASLVSWFQVLLHVPHKARSSR